MAVLITPSNNTGWGLGLKGMYGGRLIGGARVRSDAYPVRVRKHYRAPWGSVSRGRRPVVTRQELRDRRRRDRERDRRDRRTRRRRGRRGSRAPSPPSDSPPVQRPPPPKKRYIAVNLPVTRVTPAPTVPRASARIASRRERGMVIRYHPSLRPRARLGRRRRARTNNTTAPVA
uniref:Adenoviral core protein VII n=1 Tax=Pipistrellus pipistrellus adenovirus TaxID=3140007 RepID=A0AAU6S539_9ADEN